MSRVSPVIQSIVVGVVCWNLLSISPNNNGVVMRMRSFVMLCCAPGAVVFSAFVECSDASHHEESLEAAVPSVDFGLFGWFLVDFA